MTDQRPDLDTILMLMEDDDGDIVLVDGEPTVGSLVARDLRGPREIHWRAARGRYDAAVARRDRLAYDDPRRRDAEEDVRHAGRLLGAESALGQAWFDFVKGESGP